MSIISNKSAFIKHLQSGPPKLDARMCHIMQWTLETFHHSLLQMTPVWSGSAVANFTWSTGLPSMVYVSYADSGQPFGPTNDMPLGSEPQRAANEAISDASFATLSFDNPYQVYWLSNNDPDIMLIEYGQLPLPPHRIRSKAMVAHSLELAKYVLHSMVG